MGHDLVSPGLRRNAKSMRRQMTEAELKLWNEVRAHRLMGMSFRRQVLIKPYIADFACSKYRLIVEIDGSQHADAEAIALDDARTRYLQNSGWTVLRFWNEDVLRDLEGVCRHILTVCGLMAEDAARRAGTAQDNKHPTAADLHIQRECNP